MRKSTEKGSVLISVLILVVIVVLIMVAVASFITGGIQRTKTTSSRLQALYLAEAGVEKAIEQLKEDWDNTNPVDWTDFPSSPSSGKVGEYRFEFENDRDDSERIIAGYGKVEIAGRRLIKEKVTMTLKPLALSVGGKINMGEGSSKIIGDVATNYGPVEFPSDSQLVGSLYFGPSVENPRAEITHPSWKPLQREEGNSTEPCITGEIGSLTEEIVYPPPEFPEYPTGLDERPDPNPDWDDAIVISEDGYYPTFSIGSDRTVTIDTGGENDERVILVYDFNLSQGRIVLQGSGKLKLYVKNGFTMGGSSTINYGTSGEGDPAQMTLYYGGTNPFALGGDVGFNGTIVVKNADVNIDNSGKFTGNLISGGTKVTVEGDGSAVVNVIYAPNATVKLANSGKVRGAVVCQNFEASGNALLIYDKSVQNIELPADVLPSLGSRNIFITSWESESITAKQESETLQ